MLRITPMKNSAAAKEYLKKGLTKSDYYTEGQEIVGDWRGSAMEDLGLYGKVTAGDFESLCDNIHPITGAQLTARMRGDRKPFYDFTFSVPKSVSVLWANTNDENLRQQIQQKFVDSINYTMDLGEKNYIETRDQTNGQNIRVPTGNLISAKFIHTTTRPIDGVPQPHLHCHVAVFNATKDKVKDQWKAIEFYKIKSVAPYLEAVFHSELAKNLQGIGINTRNTEKGFEIAECTRETINEFSKRTLQIEKVAEQNGILSAKQKARLGANTRENKSQEFTIAELRAKWQADLPENGKEFVNHYESQKPEPVIIKPEIKKEKAEIALDSSLMHGLERQSVISKENLLTYALNKDMSGVSLENLEKELNKRVKDGRLIMVEENRHISITTPEILKEEEKMISLMQKSIGNSKPINPEYRLEKSMSADQDKALYSVLQSQNGITYIKGDAGAGKTFTLNELKKGVEDVGKDVYAFAPTAIAGRQILRQEVTTNADTLQRLLADTEMQSKLKNSVTFVDEAGLIGSRDMAKLLEIRERVGFNLVLVGDTKQHASVERGDALRILENNGLEPFSLTENRRQKNLDYKEAVDYLAKGKVADSFEILEKLGAVKEIESDSVRFKAIAKEYVNTLKNYGNKDEGKKDILIVTPTHKESQVVTNRIREELRKARMLGNNEAPYQVLKDLKLTDDEHKSPEHYKKGRVVQFHQNTTGDFKKGESWEVNVNKGGQPILEKDGVKREIPYYASRNFNLFEKEKLKLAKGEVIQITANTSTEGKNKLYNGSIYTVKEITAEGKIKLNNDWELKPGFSNFKYGYTSTSHSSQGRTVQNLIIAQSSLSYGASSLQQGYVSASRGKISISWYTDSKRELKKAIEKPAIRMSATELVKKSKGFELSIS